MSVHLLRRQFTVEEYNRMIEVGILTKYDRVELIKGEIVQMAAIGRRHAACVNRLAELFIRRLGQVVIPNPDYIAPLIAVAGIVYRRCNATSVPLGAKRV